MSYIRLGWTESTLLFYFYIEEVCKETLNDELLSSQGNLIQWLYKTSGFYDKSVKEVNIQCKHTFVYKEYFSSLYNYFLRNKENNIQIHNKNHALYERFCKELHIREATNEKSDFFRFIEGKNVIIVNPMSPLMLSQYESKRCKNIYPEFPNMKSLNTYINPYTFFNEGGDDNILVTARRIVDDIKKMNVENPYIVISCGAYSNIIAQDFENVYVVGGLLLSYFGIKHGRHTNYCNGQYAEDWIDVPNEMKPQNYMKIEDGCYW